MVNKKLLGLAFGILAVGVLIIFLNAYGSNSSVDDGDMEIIDSNKFSEARGLINRSNDGSTYIGSENCSACHLDTYNSWLNNTI